jgi:threonine dehydrogenase-like Zn-dependent dehydrogenase
MTTITPQASTSPVVAMRAAFIVGEDRLELREMPVPVPDAGQVLLRTRVSSLCGSDLHRFRGATSYGSDSAVFGHETVGEVVGGDTAAFPLGTRVLHVPFPADGRVFAPLQLAAVGQLVALPDSLSDERAVLAQQLGTAVYALRRFWPSPTPPAAALVVGAGPAGLFFVRLLQQLGCERVHVVERDADRMAAARRFGAFGPPEPRSVPLAIDASGDPAGARAAVDALAVDGVLGLFGLPDDEPGRLPLTLLELFGRNLSVMGVMGAQGEPGLTAFHEAIALLAEGAVDIDGIITHRGVLDDLPGLCALATTIHGGVGKVLVDFTIDASPTERSR